MFPTEDFYGVELSAGIGHLPQWSLAFTRLHLPVASKCCESLGRNSSALLLKRSRRDSVCSRLGSIVPYKP